MCFHVLNRGNARQTIFHKEEDYLAFERVLQQGLDRQPVKLLGYCWMPNHWHMVLSPQRDGAMSKLMTWVTMTHTARHHAHYHTAGSGHLYQGRYKSFPVQDDSHFLTLMRYVERNALAAGMCERAEDWRHGSLHRWLHRHTSELKVSPWPVRRPPNWTRRVNIPVSDREEEQLRRAIARGQPFGDGGWVESTARKHDLESTLRKRGRPRVRPVKAASVNNGS